MAKVYVLTSGKGGVGKTTITATLGRALAKKGKRVVLMDADLGLSNLDVVLDLERKVVYDIVDVVENRCRPRQALVEDSLVQGLYVLPGKSYGDERVVGGARLRAVIHALSPMFDYILIDCPAGIEAGFHRAVAAADEALLITTPHVSALHDAGKVVALLKSYNLPTHLIINRARGDMILDQEQFSCEDVVRLLKVPPVGILPEDDGVGAYVSFGGINPKAEFATAMLVLADNLIGGGWTQFDVTRKYKGFLGKFKRSLKKMV